MNSLGLLLAASGGALGAVMRYLIGIAAIRLMGPSFPWGTLTVNILGSFLMGVLIIMLLERFQDQNIKIFFATGVLGGFTTFSAFALDIVTLVDRKEYFLSALYISSSLICSVLVLLLGMSLAKSLLH